MRVPVEAIFPTFLNFVLAIAIICLAIALLRR
jgi:hypothetical protein